MGSRVAETPAPPLDIESCWRAFASKDRRFDGRFVVGVVTTGIYCRPGCPAPSPKRKNVRFFANVAAAEEFGLRPCFRCRPDSVPGSPAWTGSPATVQRALRLLAEGGGKDGLEELAARLGVGTRHLRRLFAVHVGASPIAVARTQKLHFARKLLDETDLPMSEVALSSGYGSIRRFNDAMKSTFRRTPTELRDKRRTKPDPSTGIVLRLPYRAPFAWAELIGFLAPRAISGVEIVEGDTYRRTIAVGGDGEERVVGTIEVRPSPDGDSSLELSIFVPVVRGLYAIVERVRGLFDLRADPEMVSSVLAKDRALGKSIRARPGLRVPGAWDGFETAVRAILGQQVSVRGATTLAGRLVAAWGEPLAVPVRGLTHLFPEPGVLARADISQRIGMPAARARAISLLAAEVDAGNLALTSGTPEPHVLERLRAIRGVGTWTTSYVAMRALAEPDAFPEGDLGLRKVFGKDGALMSATDLLARAEAWRPWRAYAAMHLWAMLGDKGELS